MSARMQRAIRKRIRRDRGLPANRGDRGAIRFFDETGRWRLDVLRGAYAATRSPEKGRHPHDR